MEENKNEIFQALADKLDEKEFQYNPSHWEAAEKIIPSNNSFWSPKWIAATSSVVIISGILTYNLLSEKEAIQVSEPVEKQVVIQDIPTEKINSKEIIELKDSDFENQKTEEEDKLVDEVKNKQVENSIKREKKNISEKPEKVNLVKPKPQEVFNETLPVQEEEIVDLTAQEYKEYKEILGRGDIRDRIGGNVEKGVEEDENELEEEIAESNNDEIIVPNIFTPNGDNKNDYFVISNLEGEGWNLVVYNLLDEIIYESSNYDNQWNGKDVKDGRYIYKLFNKEINKEYTGSFELQR